MGSFAPHAGSRMRATRDFLTALKNPLQFIEKSDVEFFVIQKSESENTRVSLTISGWTPDRNLSMHEPEAWIASLSPKIR